MSHVYPWAKARPARWLSYLPVIAFPLDHVWLRFNFNAWHMRTRVTVVCESVCYHSSASLRRVCDKLNLPGKSQLNYKVFNLWIWLNTSLSWVMACFSFGTAKRADICNFQYRKPCRVVSTMYTSQACAFMKLDRLTIFTYESFE